jgi:gas vesicle protein
MARKTDTLLAFVLGAAVGGIAALLLAPDKGEVTRQRLREGGGRLVDRGKDAVSKAAAAVEDAAKEKGQSATEAARQQMSALGSAAAAAKDAYRRELDKG